MVYQRAFNHLTAYLSEDTLLQDVIKYNVECYSRFLRQERELTESTVRKTVAVAKQMLRSAMKSHLLTENPFTEEKITPP